MCSTPFAFICIFEEKNTKKGFYTEGVSRAEMEKGISFAAMKFDNFEKVVEF
jgi:hypothetical protein